MFTTPGSNHVLSVDHDGSSLVVVYKNGSVYHYPGVPLAAHDALAQHVAKGGSAGQWLNQNVKGRFDHVKVTEGS